MRSCRRRRNSLQSRSHTRGHAGACNWCARAAAPVTRGTNMRLPLRFVLLAGFLAVLGTSAGKRERAKRRSIKRHTGGATGSAGSPSDIADCQFGLDFLTVDELFQRPEPCLVRNFETEKHRRVAREWEPSLLPGRVEVRKLLSTEPSTVLTQSHSARLGASTRNPAAHDV